jgi:hypothetical protein
MTDSAVRCSICSVKQSGLTQASGGTSAALSERKYNNVAGIYGGGLVDPDFYTNTYRLADINARLNVETAPVLPIAPYINPTATTYIPSGPTYSCKNCSTVNSVDDVYCVVCGIRAPEKAIRDAVRKAKAGIFDAALPAPETAQFAPETPVAIPEFGQPTKFSASLNTLEAALKPYVYNYTVNIDNNINGNNGQACPYAHEKQQPEPQYQAEPELMLSQEDIERQKRAVLASAKKSIRSQVSVHRRLWSAIALALSILIIATFFIHTIPFTQVHDMDDNEANIQESSGIDIALSVLTILHKDDTYQAITDILKGVGIEINEAYYQDVVMDLDKYTDMQVWIAHAVPFTVIIALLIAIINLIFFIIKAVTGNLKKKVYLISVLQLIFFVIVAAEILFMTVVLGDVFNFALGYGGVVTILLSVLVIAVEKLFGKEYPMSERERIKSQYGY